MKKSLFLVSISVALLLTLVLAGCGGKAPSGTDTSGSSQQTGSSENEDLPPVGQTKITTEGNKVISTLNDGLGTVSVTEYVFSDGVLSEINVTMKCASAAAAQAVYNSMKTGELKETTDLTYSEFKLNGNTVVCKMNDNTKAAFTGLTQSALAAALSGNISSGDGMSSSQTDGKTALTVEWNALTLPAGFPKLYDGVTHFTELSPVSFSIDWNILPRSDADGIVSKLEAWLGTSSEKSENDGVATWNISGDNMYITVSYYSDTFGGAMQQCTVSVMSFE